MGRYEALFTPACLDGIFPAEERTKAFFDALFGDAEEGAYDIRLTFHGAQGQKAEQMPQRGICHGSENAFCTSHGKSGKDANGWPLSATRLFCKGSTARKSWQVSAAFCRKKASFVRKG